MTDPVIGMTQKGEPIRASEIGYVSYDKVDELVLTDEERAVMMETWAPGKGKVGVEMKGTFNEPPDPVNQPAHYKAKGFECIDVIEALGLDYHLGNTVKYIWRAESKGNYLEDLRKARWYLDRYITLLENAE
jgi:hypothetical protein